MSLTIGKIPRTKTAPSGGSVDLEDVPAGAAVADVVTTTLPANGFIGGLTISNPPTQAEVQALRDECEKLRDVLAASITTIHALRDRLKVTGGNGLIAD